jgi:hypothetical protein
MRIDLGCVDQLDPNVDDDIDGGSARHPGPRRAPPPPRIRSIIDWLLQSRAKEEKWVSGCGSGRFVHL